MHISAVVLHCVSELLKIWSDLLPKAHQFRANFVGVNNLTKFNINVRAEKFFLSVLSMHFMGKSFEIGVFICFRFFKRKIFLGLIMVKGARIRF